MTERICQYGNCENTRVEITVNYRTAGERPAFCCAEHAALWLMERAPKGRGSQIEIGRFVLREKDRSEIEGEA